jgi:hypothetical protein
MAGARKFALKYITRDAAEISGIPYVMDADMEEVDRMIPVSSFVFKIDKRAYNKLLNSRREKTHEDSQIGHGTD